MGLRRHAPTLKFLRPAAGSGRRGGRAPAITAGDPGTMRGSGPPTPGPGRDRGGRPPPALRNKRSRRAGTERPAGKTGGNFARGRGGGARPGGASRRDAPHNSQAERGKVGRHGPAPPGPGSAQYLVVLLPAARGGRRRPAGAARHVHVQGAGERAPQGPHPPRQPHGRQAQTQPAREQSHRGPRPLARITAGAGARRRTRHRLQPPPPPPPPPPRIEPSRPTRPSSPFRAEAGGGEERAARSLPASPFLSAPGTPPPPAPVSTRSTYARLRRVLSEARSLLPNERAGQEVGQRERASAWRASPPPVWSRLLIMAETILRPLGQWR